MNKAIYIGIYWVNPLREMSLGLYTREGVDEDDNQIVELVIGLFIISIRLGKIYYGTTDSE